MAKTFKNLQDEVLQWTADEGDTGLMLKLVKQAIDKSNRKILSSEQLDFMISPVRTLSVVSGQKVYPLPDDFLSLLYVKNVVTGDYLEEIPAKSQLEADEGLADLGDMSRFMIQQLDGVRVQPSVPATITVTAAGSEAAANGVIIQGLDANGVWVEEALTSGSAWTTLTTATTFEQITSVIKTGDTWTYGIVVDDGTDTLLSLADDEFTKQYQQLEFNQTPTTSVELVYRYYRKPVDLVYDHQGTQIPDAYRDILVYDALLALPGYIKADAEELQAWFALREELHKNLKQNYQQSRSLGARARRVRMIERI